MLTKVLRRFNSGVKNFCNMNELLLQYAEKKCCFKLKTGQDLTTVGSLYFPEKDDPGNKGYFYSSANLWPNY